MELPRYVHRNPVGGKVYLTFQRNRGLPHAGPRVRIHAEPNTAEFWTIYNELLSAKPAEVEKGSVSKLVKDYRASPEWSALKPGTQRNYSIYLDIFEQRLGAYQADEISASVVLKMRDSFADRKVTANHIVSVVKTLYRWGIPREFATLNPAREIDRLKVNSEGMKPWPPALLDLAMTKTRWEVATFVALGLYTGQRSADILTMRLQDIDGNRIAVKQSKTDKRLQIPIHTKLKPFIDACRVRGNIYLVPGHGGRPLTVNRWRAIWGREHDKEGLTALQTVAPHGLRKSAVVSLREVGCSVEEIQAITGQSKPMVEHYAKGVDQMMMADRAMQRWEAGEVVQIGAKTAQI